MELDFFYNRKSRSKTTQMDKESTEKEKMTEKEIYERLERMNLLHAEMDKKQLISDPHLYFMHIPQNPKPS